MRRAKLKIKPPPLEIPSCSDRFVTCVDGTITTAIGNSGEIVVETSYTNYAIHYLEDSSIN